MKSCGHKEHNTNCWECVADSLRVENNSLHAQLAEAREVIESLEFITNYQSYEEDQPPSKDHGMVDGVKARAYLEKYKNENNF